MSDREAFYVNLKQKLIETTTFPSAYLYKFIVISDKVKIKQIEDEENTNEREETSQYPPIISYDESGNEEELSIQPI